MNRTLGDNDDILFPNREQIYLPGIVHRKYFVQYHILHHKLKKKKVIKKNKYCKLKYIFYYKTSINPLTANNELSWHENLTFYGLLKYFYYQTSISLMAKQS